MPTNSTIISASQALDHLQDPKWIFVDCRFNLSNPGWGHEEYQHGHIPGAVFADINKDLSGKTTSETGRHPLPNPEDFIQKVEDWGIDLHKQVVAYDHASGAYAARLWWLLQTYGHESVAVLDGGLQAWTAAGYPLTAAVENPKKAVFDGLPDPNQWVTTHEVEAMLKDPSFMIIDARAPERFRGEQEPIDHVAGHIPGAVNHFHHENLTSDGYFLVPSQLYQAYEELIGDLPADHVIVYCGSGVTACHNLLAMEIAGLYGAKLYAGSWSEWIRNPRRPIEIGE